MKTSEFSFGNEQDRDAAVDIIIKMREKRPAPKLAPSYIVAALGAEADEFKRLLKERGIPHEVTYQGEIPDDRFVDA